MSKQKVVLDANVLYGSFLRDLLLSLFYAGIYEAKWTDKIMQEWTGHLVKNRQDITPKKTGKNRGINERHHPRRIGEQVSRTHPND